MSQRCLAILLLIAFSIPVSAQQKGYYRMPAIHDKTIVFVAEGDLWKYDLVSRLATRLTTHPGLEENPLISPDGSRVVFTGQYEGPSELYIMDLTGGIPKRLTYDFGATRRATGWTADGLLIISSLANTQIPAPQLELLNPATRARTTIPLWQAAFGSKDNSETLYFTRFPNQGSKTKRYKGGFIEQVWKYSGQEEAVNLTADYPGISSNPNWHNGRVYFLSDRDGTMNLFSMNGEGKDLLQLTHSKGWDLQGLSLFEGSAVYQKGADICLLDIASKKEEVLNISLVSDFDQRKPKWIKGPEGSISDAAISPTGAYAAIISRGRVFVSPSKSDRWVEVTRKSGVRYKDVQFINNKSLAVLSDVSGEYEIWRMNADGTDTAVQITRNSKTLINLYSISPDEQMIAYCDKNQVLRVADVSTGQVRYTIDSIAGSIEEISWSPNSRFLTISQSLLNTNYQISVLDRLNWKLSALTTDRLDSYSPVWSVDSNWIYFISDRNLVSKVLSPWGQRQPEPFYTETGNIFALSIDSSGKFPFLQTDSWLTDSIFNPVKPVVPVKPSKKPSPPRAYDWEKIAKKIYTVPVPSSNIRTVALADGYLYWVNVNDQGQAGKLMALKVEESKTYEPVEVLTEVAGLSLSADRKKLLIATTNRQILIADANGQKILPAKAALSLTNWAFSLNPQQEWKEMFQDAWRMMRDYFYDRKLHNIDWVSVRSQYEPLLDRLTDRFELDDLLGQMVGELSALHHFVYGGDKRRSPDQIQTGFLGAALSKTAKGMRIDRIYQSDPDFPAFSSPLNKPELRISDGDVITAVNNVSVSEVTDIAELLANKVQVPVKLNLLDKAGKEYQQVVTPVSFMDAFTLRYEEWEYKNRLKVDSISGNEIGYIHLKAMTGNDMDDFVKQFYPVFTRKGLIIDVRMNNGGNIDSWILEKLMRKVWMYWKGRAGAPYWNMQYAFNGHMVILCDQMTASDGEAVSEGFRRLGLGKIMGMRTWGGEIWLTSSNRMVDNGIASAAEFGVYGPEGQWLIEGHGVDPDIEVDNLPAASFRGRDAQLEAAIDHLKKLIRDKPVTVPAAPTYPDKSFKY